MDGNPDVVRAAQRIASGFEVARRPGHQVHAAPLGGEAVRTGGPEPDPFALSGTGTDCGGSSFIRRSDSSTGSSPQAARMAHTVAGHAPDRSGSRLRITARQARTGATRRSGRRTALRHPTPTGVPARGRLSSAAAATPSASARRTSTSSSTRVSIGYVVRQSGSSEKVCCARRQWNRAIFAGPQGVYRLQVP